MTDSKCDAHVDDETGVVASSVMKEPKGCMDESSKLTVEDVLMFRNTQKPFAWLPTIATFVCSIMVALMIYFLAKFDRIEQVVNQNNAGIGDIQQNVAIIKKEIEDLHSITDAHIQLIKELHPKDKILFVPRNNSVNAQASELPTGLIEQELDPIVERLSGFAVISDSRIENYVYARLSLSELRKIIKTNNFKNEGHVIGACVVYIRERLNHCGVEVSKGVNPTLTSSW